ncbi:hypothetical protein BV898_04076 [Hypsibius exemplaris]|uniref:Uncharacterized protein n=1 Tax=Hypsibius exemplaris TaxID=2072580 RepID=A0A1W0X3K0_HYPEX|nr:hypothetical protein BV898_04076 [Hypsibius exemplaris]
MRPDKLEELDTVICTSLSTITYTNMTEEMWRQATFTVIRGGLGIRQTVELSFPTYLASAHSVYHPMQQIFPGVDLDDATVEPTRRWKAVIDVPTPAKPKTQK